MGSNDVGLYYCIYFRECNFIHRILTKTHCTQQLYNPFLYTVLNSSRARTLFFVLDFLDVLPNEKIRNHPRKTRSAIDS